jgi:hypothetical protein
MKKENKVYEVLWQDAWIDPQDYSLEKAKIQKPIERYTIGYLVDENIEERLVLSTDYFVVGSDVNSLIVIPTGMIKKIWSYDLQ